MVSFMIFTASVRNILDTTIVILIFSSHLSSFLCYCFFSCFHLTFYMHCYS
jgi:hypothetical protein